jgi:hypothetical protein
LFGDEAEDASDAVALHEDVDAEPANPAYGVTEVEFQILLKKLLLAFRKDFKDQPVAHLCGHVLVVQPYHLAVNPKERRGAAGEVQV